MGVAREFLPPSLLPLKERDWKLLPLSKSQETQENLLELDKAALCKQTKQTNNQNRPTEKKHFEIRPQQMQSPHSWVLLSHSKTLLLGYWFLPCSIPP